MDTNATEYLRVLNAVCRPFSHGTDAGDIEQAVRAMRAINPAHALLPALEVKARQLKMENAAREKFLETAANSLCDD